MTSIKTAMMANGTPGIATIMMDTILDLRKYLTKSPASSQINPTNIHGFNWMYVNFISSKNHQSIKMNSGIHKIQKRYLVMMLGCGTKVREFWVDWLFVFSALAH